jgi:hypothetical protein
VRERRVVVRAALEQDALAHRLLEKLSLYRRVIEPQEPHLVESPNRHSRNPARLHGGLDRRPHRRTNPA